MLKAEVIETLPYGCVTWKPDMLNYDRRYGRLTTPCSSDVPRLAKTEKRDDQAL